jgi:4-diphosphocytidyl-2C-methyl-D-erythritol kinase
MLLDALRATGPAWARMSGSGSTIVGAFRDRAARDAALEAMKGEVDAVAAETASRS